MITLLLGTNPYPFSRLLRAVDDWAASSGEQVIAQVGHTPAQADNIECHDFVSHEQIMRWLEGSELLICQGGFGSIMDCLRAGKPTIAVPRHSELGECQDDQSELVVALAEEGRLICLQDMRDLATSIAAARDMVVPPQEESAIPALVLGAVTQALAGKV